VEGEDDHGLYVWPATAQVTLLQVDLVPPQKNERKELIGKDVPGSVSLEREFDRICDLWLAPPNPSHLHIIVELPPGERCVHWVSEISLTVSRHPYSFLFHHPLNALGLTKRLASSTHYCRASFWWSGPDHCSPGW
jgi:hypothetical protein